MTRDELLARMRELQDVKKVIILKNGKRLRLQGLHPFLPSSRLIVSPDFKQHVYVEYDDIREVRPLPASRRKAN